MAHGKVRHHRNAQVEGALSQHLIEIEAVVSRLLGAAIGLPPAFEAAEADAGQLLQRSAEAPVGEHPLDPVGRFPHVLEHQDRAAQGRQVRRAEQVGGHREVGHQERPLRYATAPAHRLEVVHRLAEQQGPQPLNAPGGLGRQGGEQRTVHRADLAPVHPVPEQGGDIGEPQQPPLWLGQRLLQQPRRPPAAPHADPQGRWRCGGIAFRIVV